MKNKIKFIIILSLLAIVLIGLFTAIFTIFFDQALLVRDNTFYRGDCKEKLVALTFDDGPSPWTEKILQELDKAQIKATFFMIGKYVEKYPGIARAVVAGGHEIGNHTFHHDVLLYYDKEELRDEIQKNEEVVKRITGIKTKYFRPPKAWLSKREKKKIKEMGYEIVLWSLNSKDWVMFDDKYIVRFIVKNVVPGDIILFHDGGGAFKSEGGDRHETVLAIRKLAEKLKEKGYKFVTISELLACQKANK